MRNYNPNPVIKRIAVKAECFFTSPAILGSGYGENTDSDILRDSKGTPFLSGSTVAGALNHLCPQAAAIFGGKDDISPLWVYDCNLPKESVIELDGVALDPKHENKTASDEAKFDYEAISTDTKFTIRLLLTVRKGDRDKGYEGMLANIVGALKSNSIAFGAKTRRGFGRTGCISTVKREFDLSHGNHDILNDWIGFDWESTSGWAVAESCEFSGKTATITAKLRLEDGSIMIRSTSNIFDESSTEAPDYGHISVGNKPVILGTSWAGAIRSGLYKLLIQKFPDSTEVYLNEAFGSVSEDERNATASQIIFGMSTLEAKDAACDGYRSITRVKIDRFTGGAAQGALLTEKPWYGGETTLEIRYPDNREDIKELILLGLEGIDSGLMQIGGETSIGRGFFKVVAINGEEPKSFLKKPKNNLLKAITGEVQQYDN